MGGGDGGGVGVAPWWRRWLSFLSSLFSFAPVVVVVVKEKVRLREVDLKAKEAKLKQEEEKLRAVRAQLLSKIANTDLDPSLQERATRGVLLSPRNAVSGIEAQDGGRRNGGSERLTWIWGFFFLSLSRRRRQVRLM